MSIHADSSSVTECSMPSRAERSAGNGAEGHASPQYDIACPSTPAESMRWLKINKDVFKSYLEIVILSCLSSTRQWPHLGVSRSSFAGQHAPRKHAD